MNERLNRVKVTVFVAALLLATTAGVRAAGTGTLDRISGWYEVGSNVTVAATPDLYSQFDRWSGETNGCEITGNQITFTVLGPRAITAIFKDVVTEETEVPHSWLADQDLSWTNNFEAAVTNDPDGDGFTTGQEYWTGTNPKDSNSLFVVDAIYVTATNVLIEWRHARVGADGIPPIAVQRATCLTNPVWELVGEKEPVNGTNQWSSGVVPAAYYRIVATNMP